MHSLAHPDFVFSKLEQTIVHDASRDEIVSRFGTGEKEWGTWRSLKREVKEVKKGERNGGVVLNESWNRGICLGRRFKRYYNDLKRL